MDVRAHAVPPRSSSADGEVTPGSGSPGAAVRRIGAIRRLIEGSIPSTHSRLYLSENPLDHEAGPRSTAVGRCHTWSSVFLELLVLVASVDVRVLVSASARRTGPRAGQDPPADCSGLTLPSFDRELSSSQAPGIADAAYCTLLTRGPQAGPVYVLEDALL